MAKRNRQGRRDLPRVASEFNELLAPSVSTRSVSALSEIEDRRLFSPPVFAPARTLSGVARLFLAPARSKPKVASGHVGLSFSAPRATLVCIRRQRRKEVLHAKGVAGSKVARPKRGHFSSVSCRR